VQGLDLIHHEHLELVRLIDVVLALADDSRAGMDQLAAARHALGQAGNRHIVNKQRIVIATLQASPDPVHQALGRRFTEDLMKLRQSASEHYGIWTMAAIQDDRKGFGVAVRYQRRLLRARVAWEESAVFPIVSALLAPSLVPHRRAGGIR